ncbi:MAG: hypothetical protein FJW31_24090 [Acidobacteria bacterium]|nr:hypothetical protein [Acidobacteriota bacterium]
MRAWAAIPAACTAILVAAGNKPEEQARFLAEGEAKMVVARRCANCHTAGNFTKFRKDEAGWEQVMADMANRGAEIPDDDYDGIVAYLARNYGPAAKMVINRAPVEEVGKILELSKEQARSVVAWRDAKGVFRSFEDLVKVPGLDARKLESKREMLAF